MDKEKQKTERITSIGSCVVVIVLMIVLTFVITKILPTSVDPEGTVIAAADTTTETDGPQCDKYKIKVNQGKNEAWDISAYKISWGKEGIVKAWNCDGRHEHMFIPWHSIIHIKEYKVWFKQQ